MIARMGMTSRIIEVGRGPFKIMKALSLLSFLFVFTVILSGFNVRNSSAADCDCTVCHGVTVKYHGDGLSNPGNSWTSCFTCHASPPSTGSHLVHSAPLSNTTYGDTVTNTAEQYQFGCGHCHSMAVTLHRNDTKDVSLYGSSIGQSGLQACNDCHGSSAPSDHGMTCPSPADLTICTSCHTGHTTGHMSTSSATITPAKVIAGCASCHTEYASGAHAGTTRDLSNSCVACHATAGLSFISHSAVPITANPGQCTTCHTGMITTHAAHTGGTAHTLTTEDNCTICHSATPRVRPTAGIMSTCGTCHGYRQINHAYFEPTCIECHVKGGNADITNIIENGCIPCHGWGTVQDLWIDASAMHDGGPPVAAFSASAGSGIDAWKVTLNTFGSVGTISSVDWGDGTVDALTTHTYASAGDKLITLNVQTASVAHSITLYDYPISGTVKRGSVGLDNVTIILTGTTSGTTVTDSNGGYSFLVRPGTYAVHAEKAGYTLSADVTSIVAAPGKTDANFTTQEVLDGGPPVAAFSASAGSGIDAWKVTLNTLGSDGTISSVNWGDGTVDTLTTHTYASAGDKSITLNILKNGQTASVTHSITLSNYPISGTVKIGGVGLGNVTITLSGTTYGTTVTDSNGAYFFLVRPGTYAVHAAKAGYILSTDVTSIVAAPGKTDANFTAQVQTAVLTVSKANSAYGSVSSSPTGISCDATCGGPSTATFDVGSVVRLTASISTGETVSSLICTGGTTATCGGTSCYSDVTIAAGGNICAAVFSDAPYVVKRVSGAVDSYYLNLADGLNAAVNEDIFYLKGVIFNESVIYDKTGVTVTLEGGYDDSSYTLRSGTTLIGGSGRSLTIRDGTVIVDRIVIY